MKIDKFNNQIFNDVDIFHLLYQDRADAVPNCLLELSPEIQNLVNIAEFIPLYYRESELGLADYDKANQDMWFMPQKYFDFDIKSYCLEKCNSVDEKSRVIEEFNEYEKLDMIKVLQWCKYFVDICISNDILWGVGRGSSVSSYVLFLIGIHRIDSLKYQLDWKEFLRQGE